MATPDPVAGLDDVASRRFFDEQVRWQVGQLGAEELSGVDVVLGAPVLPPPPRAQ